MCSERHINREDAEKKFAENQMVVPYVYNRWFHQYPNWQEDLFQEGYAALWRACCKFEDIGKVKFSTYIVNAVRYRMLHYCQRFINKHSHVLSLDTLKVSETSEGDSLFLIDILSIDEDPDSKYLIEICLDKLREEDQQIVIDILDGYTQEEVAAKHSVSQATVSRRLLWFKNLIDKEKNNDAQT